MAVFLLPQLRCVAVTGTECSPRFDCLLSGPSQERFGVQQPDLYASLVKVEIGAATLEI